MRPDRLFLDGLCSHDVDDETCDQTPQIEAAVEPVGEASKVVLGVLAVVQGMEGSGQRGLEIAQHGVDPLEAGQVARLEGADHHREVKATGIGHRTEAGQTIAVHAGARCQIGLGPLADRFRGEPSDHIELDEHRMPVIIDRDSRDKGDLVLGAPTDFAACALASEVSVIELHRAAELVGGVLRGHGPVDLLMQQPGSGIAHAKLTLERQGRQAGFGLTDEVDGQEPGRQGQFGVCHETACGQGGLMPTAIALEELTDTVADHIVITAGAARTAKSLRPARGLDRFGALCLGAKATKEFRNRHAVLELNLVEGHGAHPIVRRPQISESQAHGVSLAEAGF